MLRRYSNLYLINLPLFIHRWLGEKNALKKKREEQQRNIFTAPAALAAGRKGGGGGRRGASDETRDVKTAPEQESSKTDSEIVKVGIFFKKKKDVDPNRVHMDIYSKRNMYSTIDRERKNVFGALAEEEEAAKQLEEEERQRKWAEEEERQRKLSEDQRAIEEANKMAVAAAEDRRRSEAVDILTLERAERPHTTTSIDSESRRRTGIRAEMRRIAGIGPQTELEKRESRIRAMNDNAELMKEILIKNAKKRAAKKRNKSPLEDRIRTFFTRIEDLRKGEEEVDEATMRMEQQRRYVLMTKGVKAALELKDGYEEEENPYNTI